MAKATITLARLRELLLYDPETGKFVWRVYRGRLAYMGQCAGSQPNDEGYVHIKIDDRKYPASRLAWLYVNGTWPSEQIDHINRNPSDNRIANLRCATQSQNLANTRRRKRNLSGYKGVYWNWRNEKWHAQIYARGKKRHLGFFSSAKAAHAAYLAAAVFYHGEFAHGA